MRLLSASMLFLSLTVNAIHPGAALAKAPPLRVALGGDNMPLHGTEGGQFVGLEADLAKALAAQLGRPLEIVNLDELGKGSYDAIADGDVDLSLNSLATGAPLPDGIAYSAPYAEITIRLAAKPGTSLDNLAERQVAVAVLDPLVRDLVLQQMPKAKIEPRQSPREGVVALMRGKVDFFAHSVSGLRQSIKDTNLEVVGPKLGTLSLALAAPQAHVAAYNQALKRLASTATKLQAKWLAAEKEQGGDGDPLATLPASWVELAPRGQGFIIPVYCEAATARINLNKVDGRWVIEFNLGPDTVEGSVDKVDVLGKGHYRLHYQGQSVEVRFQKGAKTGQWGKSTELWGGKLKTFADAARESEYRGARVEKCP